jgi:hypothetical protein
MNVAQLLQHDPAARFVAAILESFNFRRLSLPVVSDADAERAQLLIDAWQKLIPEFCHETSQTFNAHAVGHLPDQVKQFGPLWSISTFPFESFNGHFAR